MCRRTIEHPLLLRDILGCKKHWDSDLYIMLSKSSMIQKVRTRGQEVLVSYPGPSKCLTVQSFLEQLRLADPEVASNPSEYQKIAKSVSELEEVRLSERPLWISCLSACCPSMAKANQINNQLASRSIRMLERK
jgi:hypothetical protein